MTDNKIVQQILAGQKAGSEENAPTPSKSKSIAEQIVEEQNQTAAWLKENAARATSNALAFDIARTHEKVDEAKAKVAQMGEGLALPKTVHPLEQFANEKIMKSQEEMAKFHEESAKQAKEKVAREYYEELGTLTGERGQELISEASKRLGDMAKPMLSKETEAKLARRKNAGAIISDKIKVDPLAKELRDYGKAMTTYSMGKLTGKDYISFEDLPKMAQVEGNKIADAYIAEHPDEAWRKEHLANYFANEVYGAAHEQRMNNDDKYFRETFKAVTGEEYDTYLRKRVNEAKKQITALRDEAETEARETVYDNYSYTPSFSHGAGAIPQSAITSAMAYGSGSGAAKPYNDLLEEIEKWEKNDFGSGFSASFDLGSMLSLDLVDIANESHLNDVLARAYNGEKLHGNDARLYELYKIQAELEGIRKIIYEPQGWMSSIGEGIGTSVNMLPEFALMMTGTGSIGKFAKMGTMAGLKTAFEVGGKTLRKYSANVLRKGVHNFGVAKVRGLAAAPLMPTTYNTYLETLNSGYKFDEDGNLTYEPVDKTQAALGAWFTSANEISSEYLGVGIGHVVGWGGKKFGKWIADTKVGEIATGVVNKVRKHVPKLTPQAKVAMRTLGVQVDPVTETLSEALGDIMTSYEQTWIGMDVDKSQYGTLDYWITLAGVSLGYGGSMAAMGAVKSYRDVKKAVKARDEILGGVINRNLYNTLVAVSTTDDVVLASSALADFDWEGNYTSPEEMKADMERARAFRAADLNVKIMQGMTDESGRLERFQGALDKMRGIAYKGANGEITGEIVEAEVDGKSVYVINGREAGNTTGLYVVVDPETGKRTSVDKSKVIETREYTIDEYIDEAYNKAFSLEEEKQRVADIKEKALQMDNPTEKDVARVASTLGIKIPKVGTTVMLANGSMGAVTEVLSPTEYAVQDMTGATYKVHFTDILSTDKLTATAQGALARGEVARPIAPAPKVETETTTETTAPDENGITIGAEVTVDGRVGKVRARTQDGKYAVAFEDESGNYEDTEMEFFTGEELASLMGIAPMPTAEAPKTPETTMEVATTEDGSVDVEQMSAEDAAKALIQRTGTIEEAIVQVKQVIENTVEERKKAAKAEKKTSLNDIGKKSAELQALDTRLEFFGEVLGVLEGMLAEQQKQTMTEAQNIAEEAGVAPETTDATDTTTEENKPVEMPTSGLVRNGAEMKFTDNVIKMVDFVAKRLGIIVEFVDGLKDEAGQPINGDIKGKHVRISTSGTKGIKFIMGHEFFHRMKDLVDEQTYADFVNSIKEYAGEKLWNATMAHQRNVYRNHNVRVAKEAMAEMTIEDVAKIAARLNVNIEGLSLEDAKTAVAKGAAMGKEQGVAEVDAIFPKMLSYDDALMVEECAADVAGGLVTNTNAFAKYVEDNSSNIALVRGIRKAIRAMRELFGSFGYTDQHRKLNALEKSLANVLNEAAKNEAKATTEGQSRKSLQEIEESAERLAEQGAVVNTESGDVRFALQDVLVGDAREQAIADLMRVTGRSRATVLKYLKAEESLASIILDDDNQKFLDLQVDESVPSIWKNSDYPQGTVEFSNICRKRLPYTMIYQRLQKDFPNVVFDASALESIRQTMIANGEQVACALCFVEDRRQLMGEIGQSFIDALKGEEVELNDKQKTALERLRKSGDTYIPSLFEITTLDGMKFLRKKHPEVASAFIAYNNARGMQSARLFQAYSAYHREILNFTEARVKRINKNGGLRIFSFSDFEAHHLIDLVQVLTDCAAKGVMVQGYTKVPEFANAVKDTKMKLNRSLIGKSKGVVDADHVPQEGEAVSPNVIDGKRLLFDTVEGIDVNSKDFFDSTNSPNVGNILVTYNEEQTRIAMQDPFVDYIIPFHTGIRADILEQKGIGDWVNYKNYQSERVEKDGILKKVNKGINIYTDVLSKDINTERQFVNKYLAVCKAKGYVPKFDMFLDKTKKGEYTYTKGYYKFLLDFKMFDKNGKILPQEVVVPVFDNEVNKQILEDYVADEKAKAPNDELYGKVVDAMVEQGRLTEAQVEEAMGTRFSIIGEVGASALDMAEEATIRMDNLAIARQMEERGDSALDIRMATGWERGADGLWRYEIMDYVTPKTFTNLTGKGKEKILAERNAERKALEQRINNLETIMKMEYALDMFSKLSWPKEVVDKIQAIADEYKGDKERMMADYEEAMQRVFRMYAYGDTTFMLEEVIGKDHEIFKAYPELKDVSVEIEKNNGQDYGGNYNPKTKRIKIVDYKDRGKHEAGAIVHEIQHAIQYIEGFTTGINPKTELPLSEEQKKSLEVIREMTSFVDLYKDNLADAIEEGVEYGNPIWDSLSQHAKTMLKYFGRRMRDGQTIDYVNESLKNMHESASVNLVGKERYHRQAGEVEARNVQKRLNMSAEERLNTLLSETEDVAREDQIFIRDGVEMAMARKKSAQETVSVPTEHHQTAISSADGTKLLKNIDSAIEKYKNDSYPKVKTFLGNIADVLKAQKRGGKSRYATFEAMNGNVFTIRLSDHNATVKNFDDNNEKEGVSIVITTGENKGINVGGVAHIVEYFYDAIKLRKAEGYPLVDILKSIKQALYSGVYKDTTGLAQVEDVNSPSPLSEATGKKRVRHSLISPEMDADYLSAVERGDMETAQQMVMEAAKLAMPNTKVVDENGNPKVVYHGSKSAFNVFSIDKFGKTDAGYQGKGFYFTPDEKYAQTYGDIQRAFFLNITNPIDALKNEVEAFAFGSDTVEDVMARVENSKEDLGDKYESFVAIVRETITPEKLAEINTHDGTMLNTTYSPEYVTGSPNQIKSADPVTYDDNGNVIPLSERFNPEKEDIRYSLQSVEPYVSYAKNMARALNIAQPIIVVDNAEELVQLMRDAGAKNPERARTVRGVYRPTDDAFFFNAERFEKREDMFMSIFHEWTHAYTQRNIEKLEAILATLDEQHVKDAGADLLPEEYKNDTPLRILNEFISKFVEKTPKHLVLAIMRGQMPIEDFVSGLVESVKGEEYADILEAVAPVIKDNLTNQKERYNGKREEPIVFARWSGQEDASANEGDEAHRLRSNGRRGLGEEGLAQHHTENDSRRARESAQEVARYHLPDPDPSDVFFDEIPIFDEQGNEVDITTLTSEEAKEILDGKVRQMLEAEYDHAVVAIRKEAEEARQAVKEAYRAEKEKRRKGAKAARTNAARIDEIFGDTPFESLPYEVQALILIATGQAKIYWGDRGNKRGLASELGLTGSTGDRHAYRNIWGGAKKSFNEVVHDWWESLGGQERGIDDQDLRNALISALQSVQSSRDAMQEIVNKYDDLATDRDNALAEVDRNEEKELREAKNAYEQHLANFELAEGEERTAYHDRAAQFFGNQSLSRVDDILEDLTNELERSKRKIERLKAEKKDVYTPLAESIQHAKDTVLRALERLRMFAGMEEVDLNDVARLINLVKASRSQRQIEELGAEATALVQRISIKKAKTNLGRLLSLKLSNPDIIRRVLQNTEVWPQQERESMLKHLWKVSRNGLRVSKAVHPDTRAIIDELRDIVSRYKKGDEVERAKILHEMEVRIDPNIDPIDKEREVKDWAEENKQTAFILFKAYSEVLEKDTAFKVASSKVTDMMKNGVKDSSLAEGKEDKRVKGQEYLNALTLLNQNLESLIVNGKEDIRAFYTNKEEHAKEIRRMGIEAVGGDKARLLPDVNPTGKDKTKKALKRVNAAKNASVNAPYWTFDTVLNKIDRAGKNGKFYKYFMDKWSDSNVDFLRRQRDHAMRLAEAMREAFPKIARGKSAYDLFTAVLRKADETLLAPVKYLNRDREVETMRPTISSGMYILAMWRQPRYKASMEAHGITQSTIDDIYMQISEVDKGYIQFMDWVNDVFLPDTRLEYDVVHRALYGGSMAKEVNYFPANVLHYEEVKLDETTGLGNISLSPSALKERMSSMAMPNMNMNYFKVLQAHLQSMDQWASFEELRTDLSTLLSSKEFKNRLIAMQPGVKADGTGEGGLYENLFRTAKIATGLYETDYETLLSIISKAQQKWVAANIAYRFWTGLKQLSSIPIFAFYKVTDLKSYLFFGKALLRGLNPYGAVRRAMNLSPSMRMRWESRFAGLDVLMQETSKEKGIAQYRGVGKKTLDIVKDFVATINRYGMTANAAMDVMACAVGVNMIYDYEIYKATGGKREATEAEKRDAIRKAEYAFNSTQQSSEGAYMSAMQKQPALAMYTAYKNASMAAHRKRSAGLEELWKLAVSKEHKKFLREELGEDGVKMSVDTAVSDLMQGLISDVGFTFMGTWGGMLLFSLLFGWDEDDDEDREEYWEAFIKDASWSMANGYAFGGLFGEYLGSGKVTFNPALEELQNTLGRISDDKGDTLQEVLQAVFQFGIGVDLKTAYNIAASLENMFEEEDGNYSGAVLKFLNAPQGYVKAFVGDRREGETLMEYQTRIVRLNTIFDDIKYSDYFDEKGNYIGEDAPSLVMSKKQIKDLREEYEGLYLNDMLKKYGGDKGYGDYTMADLKHKQICGLLDWNPDATPSEKMVQTDMQDELEYYQKRVAEAIRERKNWVGDDEGYYDLLMDEQEAKNDLINNYYEYIKQTGLGAY